MSDIEKIEEAKKFLESKGYQTNNLWRIEDVQFKFECSEEEAMEILKKALQNFFVMDSIWETIEYYGGEMGLNKVKQIEEEAHSRHCFQGEYKNSCKYGSEECPVKK